MLFALFKESPFNVGASNSKHHAWLLARQQHYALHFKLYFKSTELLTD